MLPERCKFLQLLLESLQLLIDLPYFTSDVFSLKALDTIPFRQPQPMMAAIHPGREFGFQGMECLPLSSIERNFRKASAFDNL